MRINKSETVHNYVPLREKSVKAKGEDAVDTLKGAAAKVKSSKTSELQKTSIRAADPEKVQKMREDVDSLLKNLKGGKQIRAKLNKQTRIVKAHEYRVNHDYGFRSPEPQNVSKARARAAGFQDDLKTYDSTKEELKKIKNELKTATEENISKIQSRLERQKKNIGK